MKNDRHSYASKTSANSSLLVDLVASEIRPAMPLK